MVLQSIQASYFELILVVFFQNKPRKGARLSGSDGLKIQLERPQCAVANHHIPPT